MQAAFKNGGVLKEERRDAEPDVVSHIFLTRLRAC